MTIIRPIDLQVLIPKASEASRISHVQEINSQIQQQQFADQFAQAVRNRQKRVRDTQEMEGQRVQREQNARKDGRGEGFAQAQDERETRREGTREENSESLDMLLGKHIDVKM